MKPELMLLVWATLLTFVQAVVAAQGAFNQVGLVRLAGNREGMPDIAGWGGRAARAHRNMLENLVLFASLVVVAVLYGLGFLLAGLLIFIPIVVLASLFPVLSPFIVIGLAIYWFAKKRRQGDV